MANAIELALMAGRIYQSTRDKINWLPDLSSLGWIERIDKTQSLPSGLEATYFIKGNEIVISFAGTGSNVDWWANAGGFFGVTSTQLEQAADYYLQVKNANPPGTTISFTGHSLGGGLASLLAVFFGETAVTFDQAPFRNSASVAVANTLLSYLSDPARGYSTQDLQGLTNFIGAAANGGIPNEGNVLDFSVQGEILSAASALRIGSQTSLTHSPDNWSGSSTDLHSQALLTAFLQSDQTAPAQHSFRDVTLKLTDLSKMIFDSKLYYSDPNNTDISAKENFTESLIRHQNGVAGLVVGETAIVADAMLTCFTSDLWKIAQDGGLTLHDGSPTNADLYELSDALIAFAKQFYYEDTTNTKNANKQLFADLNTASTESNGIRFDMHDVSMAAASAIDANQKIDFTAKVNAWMRRSMRTYQLWLKQITKLGLILMMGVSMSACATSTFTWKEEVLLHDGIKIIVERSDVYDSSMHHEIGQGAPLTEHITTFKIPGTNQTVIWKSDNHSSDPDELHLLALNFINGVPYVATTPFGSNAYNKWNRPNPPYVFFKYVDGWKRISLEEFPDVFKINLIVASRKKDQLGISKAEQKFGFVPAQTVADINREPGMNREYYSILRTPLNYGLPRPQYNGPKAPHPITPPITTDSKK